MNKKVIVTGATGNLGAYVSMQLKHDGFDVIADATHLNEFSRRKLTQSIDRRYTDYEIVYVVFNVDLQTCLERNAQRTGRACVPEQSIRNMYRDFRPPTKDEDERVKEIIEV